MLQKISVSVWLSAGSIFLPFGQWTLKILWLFFSNDRDLQDWTEWLHLTCPPSGSPWKSGLQDLISGKGNPAEWIWPNCVCLSVAMQCPYSSKGSCPRALPTQPTLFGKLFLQQSNELDCINALTWKSVLLYAINLQLFSFLGISILKIADGVKKSESPCHK